MEHDLEFVSGQEVRNRSVISNVKSVKPYTRWNIIGVPGTQVVYNFHVMTASVEPRATR
jgi:hypothetical protein